MAKVKTTATAKKVNKSELIREYVKAHPDAKQSDIATKLEVEPSLVSGVLKRMNEGKATGKRGPKGKGKGKPASNGDMFDKAADFVQAAGGLDAAIEKLQKLKG